jgi:hypothetical protein
MRLVPRTFTTLLVAGGLCFSSTIANASASVAAAQSTVATTVVAQSAAAVAPSAGRALAAKLCRTSVIATQGAAALAQAPTRPGCVLPIRDDVPVVAVAPPPPVAPLAVESGGFGIGWLPLLGLAALAVAAALLLSGGGGDGDSSLSRA